jgi:hypothetical protein
MCGSEIEITDRFWMQLSIHTINTLAVNDDYIIICTKLVTTQQQVGHVYCERQWSVNAF